MINAVDDSFEIATYGKASLNNTVSKKESR